MDCVLYKAVYNLPLIYSCRTLVSSEQFGDQTCIPAVCGQSAQRPEQQSAPLDVLVASEVMYESRSLPPSCNLQGATISLLHNHLNIVYDKVKSHAPHRLH